MKKFTKNIEINENINENMKILNDFKKKLINLIKSHDILEVVEKEGSIELSNAKIDEFNLDIKISE